MLMRAGKNGLGLVVRVLCALSLALAVLAHQPVLPGSASLPETATPDLAAYALPDGTLPALCLAIDDDDEGKHGDTGRGVCEFCRIAAAMLPAPDLTLVECRRESAAALHVRAPETRTMQAFPPTAPPRGPPAFAA